MTIADVVLETRGERQVVTRFCDARLEGLFLEVWRSLPAAAVDDVYAALGDGAHRLLVCDTVPQNRPSHYLGQVARIGPHIRLHMCFYQLDDYSDGWVRAIAAHELAHIAAGHMGPAPEPEPIVPPDRLLNLLPNRTGQYARLADYDHEAAATALAESWGFPEPTTPAARRRKVNRKSVSEWTKRR